MWNFHPMFVLFMIICSSIGSAQIISNNQDCSMVYETTIYEIVKTVLASKYASIDDKLRNLSDQCAHKPIDPDLSLLFNQTETVSRLEDEIQQIKEKVFNELNQNLEMSKGNSRNISQLVENLTSVMNATFQEITSILNESNLLSIKRIANMSANISNLEHVLDNVKSNITDVVESAVENEISVKNSQLTLRITQLSESISNMERNIDSLERSNIGQNTRLGSTEAQLASLSAKLTNLMSKFEDRLSSVIRLVDGGSTYGRVEVFYNGAWGTVCDDGWDNNDARVVCRMLGLSGGTAKTGGAYGPGTGNIWLDDVNCSGSESSIFTCTQSTVGNHNCNHNEDAGVICS